MKLKSKVIMVRGPVLDRRKQLSCKSAGRIDNLTPNMAVPLYRAHAGP